MKYAAGVAERHPRSKSQSVVLISRCRVCYYLTQPLNYRYLSQAPPPSFGADSELDGRSFSPRSILKHGEMYIIIEGTLEYE